LHPQSNDSSTVIIFAVGRARRYSPNSVGKDAAILESVSCTLEREGYGIRIVSEDTSWTNGEAFAYISMGRSGKTLERLAREEGLGRVVINSTESVSLCCNRRRLNHVLSKGGIPVPPSDGNHGYWLKRGDGVAETSCDVRFASDKAEMLVVKCKMQEAGIKDIVVQAHVEGDLVKFYGVRGTSFFRTFYPGDDGQTKFGDEQRNGIPKYYRFSVEALHGMAEQAARLVGIDVYGGDCIISRKGTFTLIDFNDWPSFSRCKEEAAEAIAKMVVERIQLRYGREQLKIKRNALH